MKQQVYYIEYDLLNPEGVEVDTSRGGEPLVFLEGAKQVVPGLEKAVIGHQPGEVLNIKIPPEMGYGLHRPNLVQTLSANQFAGVDKLQKGMLLQTGSGESRHVVKVLAVHGGEVTIDANHPLAGLTLHFEAEIKEVREASDDELTQGYATT